MKHLLLSFVLLVMVTMVGVTFLSAQETKTAGAMEIVEAKLGTGIQDKMITGEAESFPKDTQVFVWFKIAGAASQEVTVTWKMGDYSHATTLSIGGSPWRSWAQKNVRAAGEWTVTISGSDGTALKELKFKVE